MLFVQRAVAAPRFPAGGNGVRRPRAAAPCSRQVLLPLLAASWPARGGSVMARARGVYPVVPGVVYGVVCEAALGYDAPGRIFVAGEGVNEPSAREVDCVLVQQRLPAHSVADWAHCCPVRPQSAWSAETLWTVRTGRVRSLNCSV